MENIDGEDEIAAAMGFSSFGHSKKRKYDQTESPKAKIGASGANTTQLGVRPKLDAAPETVGEKQATDSAGTATQTDSCPPAAADNSNPKAKNKGKQKQKQPAATGLAAFLSRGQTLPEKPPSTDAAPDASTADRVAQPDPAASEMVSFGGAPISRAELSALQSGIRVENGDTAFFLPSFVEDPWERMKSRE